MFAQILLRTVLTTKGLLDLGGFKTRKQAQKPAHKDPKPKWSKSGHLGLGPLMLYFRNAQTGAETCS
ncbi:hypothetical protein FAM18121_00213 [Lacticaseibacillus paracasei]|nr:hypothetical protein [Lacticaseibacillus paracasei]RND56035.1 hypothetical protein FAM18121_00213 [Lacticaseibacillus paracasei]